jgi:hypothetical protein
MDKKLMKRLQAISHRVNRNKTELAAEFVSTLKKKLAERNHRADLDLSTRSKVVEGSFTAEIKFDPQLGYPTDKDLMTLVAQSYPTHEIDWDLLQVDDELGVISLMLEPSVEVLPLASIKEIPPEFTSIGTGLYKRATDTNGTVMEIWSLKKTDDGLALFKSPDDLEITAEEEGFKAGDVVNTEYGPGRIVRFDDLGNAFVQVGSKKHLVGAADLTDYDLDKEKTQLTQYYTEAYGDPDFAKRLVEEYDDAVEVDIFEPPKK